MHREFHDLLSDPSTSWLLAVAHPDDEIAVAGLLHRLVASGHKVGAFWAHSTPVRVAESQRACKILGIAESAQWFFDGQDGNMHRELNALARNFEQVLSEFRPDVVVTLAFEQGHLDHDAVSLTVSRGFSGPTFEFPMYHTYMTRFQKLNEFSSTAGVITLPLDDREREVKNQLIDCYPSQTLRRNIVAYNVLRTVTLNPLYMDRREVLRPHPEHDYGKPAHGGALGQKLTHHPTWHEWLSVLDQV